MFQVSQPANRRRRAALVVSLIVHCLVVFLWLTRAPMFIQSSSVAWGFHGNSADLIYFPRVAEPTKTAKKTSLPTKNQTETGRRSAPTAG